MEELLINSVKDAVQEIFGKELPTVELQGTRKEFEGDITVVVFPLLRTSRKSPEQTADELGEYLENNLPEIVIKYNYKVISLTCNFLSFSY